MKETTKHDKTEFDDLDLALPEDLNMDLDSSPDLPGASDDLDLELPELTMDDDASGDLPSTHAEVDLEDSAHDLESESTFSHTEDEDEEPIALSEEELERIVGDSPTEMFGDPSDDSLSTEHSPYNDTSEEFSPSEDLDLDTGSHEDHSDEDLNSRSMESDMEFEMDSTLSGMDSDPTGTDLDTDSHPAMTSDLDDEGPLALSEEELGNIMGDVSTEADFSMADAGSETLDSDMDLGSEMDLGSDHSMELGTAVEPAEHSDEDETITLSDDELNNILLDSSEESTKADASLGAPPLSEMGMDDDDEPIALTPEELGNIISDVHEEVDASTDASDFEHDEIMESATSPGLLDEEDEGPVALSDSELDSILEDVHEEPVDHEGVVERDSANLILLDEYEDKEKSEEKSHEAAARDVRVEAIAAEEGVNKQELKKMISYLDQLFDRLPEDTVREFSRSEYFDLYRKIMDDLGLS